MTDIDIGTNFARLFVQINDENRIKRKQALENILNEVIGINCNIDNDLFVCSKVIHSIFDSGERNRELTCEILNAIIHRQSNIIEFMPIIIPEIVKKLSDKDVLEPSEDVRHSLMEIVLLVIQKSGKAVSIFIQDIIKLCCQTIGDNYAEIKRISCSIINTISHLKNHDFYSSSEVLIKPLISNLCHQHSKVRLDVVNCIGNVLLSCNIKNFDPICANLAQRLFDDNSNVRKAVIDVFGKWLLDLTDRYSFHTKLIPVFLSGYFDEQEEIREMTNDYWYDIGMKYQQENEKDMKDQIDFENIILTNYPKEYERPNLGCRTLMFRSLSRILPALTRDLSDWSENTRIKAAKLLPYLIINAESACTQHCQLLIGSTLIRGLVDEEIQVRRACRESSRLLGYFIEPKVWWHIFETVVNRTDADDRFVAGEMILLSCIVESSNSSDLINSSILRSISSYLKSSDMCGSFSTEIKFSGLRCVQSVLAKFDSDHHQEVYDVIGYELFYAALSFAAYECQDADSEIVANLNSQLDSVVEKFTETLSIDSKDDLYRRFLGQILTELTEKAADWSTHSGDRVMCCKLLVCAGPIVGEFVDQIIDLLEIALNRTQELELRLKFFVTLVKLTANLNATLNSQGLVSTAQLERLLTTTILPNLAWQSGRTAEALRRVAVTCLWSICIGCCKSAMATDNGHPHDNVLASLSGPVWHELLVRQVAALDDDMKETRITAAKALVISLDVIAQHGLVASKLVSDDYLHNIYPTILKRLDDVNDEIRIIATKIILSWVQVLQAHFDASLYRAHLEDLNSVLLVHLDDSNRAVQLAVYEAILAVAKLDPKLAESEATKVRHKHRSPKYCDDLIVEIRSWSG